MLVKILNPVARLIRSNSLDSSPEISNNLVMRQLVKSEKDGPDLSVTWVAIDGNHRSLKTDASTRVYYILEGEFQFSFDDSPNMTATDGDVVVIYKSSVYGFTGTGKYLVINGPAFREGDDVYVEEGTSAE